MVGQMQVRTVCLEQPLSHVDQLTLNDNWAYGDGGGLVNAVGTAQVTNVTFSSNTAGVSGGGIYRLSGAIRLRNTIVANSPSGGNCAGG